MTTATVVRADKVWKRFGRHDALQGLNLAVPEGSAYALIGPNGAGKTTTIKLLMNLLAPTRGAAMVMGVDTRRLSPEVLAQIGYVSESQALPGRLSVGEYLDYLRPFYPGWDRALEASIRSRLQLPAERKIGALSHGMRIKVALACALPYRPKLLILDEPFSGLDPLVREEFMEGLLLEAGELTMLISSHELGEIENVATHVGFLDAGRMLIEESTNDLGARLREVRVTLEHPAAVPERLPREWLQARSYGNVLSFIDTRYSEAELGERIHALLGPVRHIDTQPLPLRSVFTTLARAARDGAMP
ncbi:MAG TPA: ABC transporter ATP-binding protein [Nevskia sp.]|nr:ABC transporter ATP-binding protein [Nevskia sp.]